MSMSQEEIEALMNGLDGPSSVETKEETIEQEETNATMSEDDIAALLEDTNEQIEAVENIDNIDEVIVEETNSNDIKDDISDVLNEIDNMEDTDLLVDDNLAKEVDELNSDPEFKEKAITWTEDKITKGEFPFPAEPSTKVVTQLSEVAQDNEEKAGQIFDVLSYIVDENSVIQKNNKKIDAFVDSQIELLNNLSTKFPNIAIFNEHLESAKATKSAIEEIATKLSEEDMKVFEAMEIMQFHDINRQKIERVMSVIRKLTAYLNNLFEEDQEYEEIAVAKHIHGDSTADLVGAEDLDALIAEFNK